jgi:hypothetical protein
MLSTDRKFNGRGQMGHGDRLATGESGFQDATDIITLCLMAVRVAEMRLDSCNPITEPADRSFHTGFNKRDDLLTSVDMVVRIDMNLHPTTSLT